MAAQLVKNMWEGCTDAFEAYGTAAQFARSTTRMCITDPPSVDKTSQHMGPLHQNLWDGCTEPYGTAARLGTRDIFYISGLGLFLGPVT